MHRKSAVCILKTHEQILALTNTHVRYILRLEHDYLKKKSQFSYVYISNLLIVKS